MGAEGTQASIDHDTKCIQAVQHVSRVCNVEAEMNTHGVQSQKQVCPMDSSDGSEVASRGYRDNDFESWIAQDQVEWYDTLLQC